MPLRADYADAVKIHRALYDRSVTEFIFPFSEGAPMYYHIPITRKDTPSARFAICAVGDQSFITQNLQKPSGHTQWVTAVPGRQLTWVVRRKGRGYLGRIQREVRDHSVAVFTVIKFYPKEAVVYTEEERL